MKKKLTYCIIAAMVLLAIGVFVFPYFTYLNRSFNSPDIWVDQLGTIWKSKNPEITIGVYDENAPERENGWVNGIIKVGDKNIKVELAFLYGTVTFEDIDKIKTGEYSNSEVIVFNGDCWYGKKKVKIKVTYSNIPEIKVGDKIVLYRQD